MADVFITYSRLDHERVQAIAERLSSLGYSLWWDKHLRRGEAFAEEVEEQLASARCVLAAWSHNARNATWVYAEASYGLDQGKLLQLSLDGAAAPPPFDAVDAPDMSGERSAWGPLEAALAKLVKDGAPASAPARAPGAFAAAAASGAPRLALVALAASLAAFVGASMAAVNGAMAADQVRVAMTGIVGVAGVCAALAALRLFTISRAGG